MPHKEAAVPHKALLDVVCVVRADEVVYAFDLFAERNLDFIDCLLVAASQVSEHKIATFDKKIAKLAGDGVIPLS